MTSAASRRNSAATRIASSTCGCGARGSGVSYVDSIVAFADVQRERLTKPYHRAWHRVTGASHARLRFRDAIDRDGRLLDEAAPGGRVWLGVPGFLYREMLVHAARWMARVLRCDWDGAFADECRLQYLVSYAATRWRERYAAPAVHGRVSGRRSS